MGWMITAVLWLVGALYFMMRFIIAWWHSESTPYAITESEFYFLMFAVCWFISSRHHDFDHKEPDHAH